MFEDEFLYEKCEQYLSSLDVSENSLTQLDSEIGDFKEMRYLNCAKNKWVHLLTYQLTNLFNLLIKSGEPVRFAGLMRSACIIFHVVRDVVP